MQPSKPWDSPPEWLREEMGEPDPAALARFLSGNPCWTELDRQRRLLQDGLGLWDEEVPQPDLWVAIRHRLEHPSERQESSPPALRSAGKRRNAP